MKAHITHLVHYDHLYIFIMIIHYNISYVAVTFIRLKSNVFCYFVPNTFIYKEMEFVYVSRFFILFISVSYLLRGYGDNTTIAVCFHVQDASTTLNQWVLVGFNLFTVMLIGTPLPPP